MRIAILNWSNRRVGGTGTYLSALIPHFERAGHDVGLWHELDSPADFDAIPLGSRTPTWNVAELGLENAVTALRRWSPDLLYAQGLQDPAVEQRVLDVAPAFFFAHDYYGTCISGAKAFSYPTITPCDRTFGLSCIASYFPRRCGGRSPVTMVREFRRQSKRLDLLRRYRAIVTHSTRMRDEYVRHGFPDSQVIKVLYSSRSRTDLTVPPGEWRRESGPWRLLFVGRMYELKGGRELLQALPIVSTSLGRDVHVTFAGDGAQRQEWESLAANLCARDARLRTTFTGWIRSEAVDELIRRADLLVVPSLWPEPFGLVGLEAGRQGVPAAAFRVGGIPDWLRPGVNGHMAPGDPPTVHGLAQAIVSCLKDEDTHATLRDGAWRVAADATFDMHVDLLLGLFQSMGRGEIDR